MFQTHPIKYSIKNISQIASNGDYSLKLLPKEPHYPAYFVYDYTFMKIIISFTEPEYIEK